MKYLLLVALSVFSLNSFANEKDHKDWEKKIDSMSFEDAKKMKKEMLDKKGEMIEKQKKCIDDAKDKAAIKECSREMWEEKKEMKHDMKKK